MFLFSYFFFLSLTLGYHLSDKRIFLFLWLCCYHRKLKKIMQIFLFSYRQSAATNCCFRFHRNKIQLPSLIALVTENKRVKCRCYYVMFSYHLLSCFQFYIFNSSRNYIYLRILNLYLDYTTHFTFNVLTSIFNTNELRVIVCIFYDPSIFFN